MIDFFFDGDTITSLAGAKISVLSSDDALAKIKQRKLTHVMNSAVAQLFMTGEPKHGVCAVLPDASLLVLWCGTNHGLAYIMLSRLWVTMSNPERHALDVSDMVAMEQW